MIELPTSMAWLLEVGPRVMLLTNLIIMLVYLGLGAAIWTVTPSISPAMRMIGTVGQFIFWCGMTHVSMFWMWWAIVGYYGHGLGWEFLAFSLVTHVVCAYKSVIAVLMILRMHKIATASLEVVGTLEAYPELASDAKEYFKQKRYELGR